MTFANYGDLASTFQSRHMNAKLKSEMTRLGVELTTGLKANLASAVSGDFGPIAGIDHTLALLVAHKQSTNEASALLGATQTALGSIQDQGARSFKKLDKRDWFAKHRSGTNDLA